MERGIRRTSSKSTRVPMGFTEETIPPGTHICYIYNDEGERKRIISLFLEAGLRNGEKVSCFMDTGTTDEIDQHLSAPGMDKTGGEQPGAFSLTTTKEAYYPGGAFVPEEMLDRLEVFYTRSINEGYTGARVTGEASWVTQDVPGSSRFMEYEARINSALLKYPITSLCQYNADLFDRAMLRDVLCVHPMVIVHGKIVNNPYYIKSWWLLKRHQGLYKE